MDLPGASSTLLCVIVLASCESGAEPMDLRLDSSGPLADCPLPKLPNGLNRISFFEDFSARLGDVPYPVPAGHDFSSSGLVVTPIGTPAPNPALVRMTGAGLQANTPGSVAGTGVNVRMRGGTLFDQDQDQQIVRPQMGAATILNLMGYPLTAYFSETFEVRYATSFLYVREEGPAWDNAWVGGLSLEDTRLTNPSSGALTQWVRNGGIVCHLGRDGVLGVYSRRITTTTLAASVDLGTETAGAAWTVACGFAADFTPGEDSITGFYKFTAGMDIETLPWQVMGTTVGSLQPLNSAAEVQTPLWEIVNGAEPGIYTLYQRYIGGCYTREEAAGEAAP